MENEDTFVPLFPGQTKEMAEYAAEAERRYLEDTRFDDGPTEVTEWPPVKAIKGY